MTTADPRVWEQLMAETIQAHLEEQADYMPGGGLAPGQGTEGDDPLGLHYADLGPLALVLNEGMDAATNRGADPDDILDQIAEAAREGGEEGPSADDAAAVLAADELCPPEALLKGFSTVLAIDLDVIVDAAKRGGCTNYGPTSTTPPGY